MNCHPVEPKLSDALADPVIRAVMTADHVDAEALKTDLRAIAVKREPFQRTGRTGQVPCREALWS